MDTVGLGGVETPPQVPYRLLYKEGGTCKCTYDDSQSQILPLKESSFTLLLLSKAFSNIFFLFLEFFYTENLSLLFLVKVMGQLCVLFLMLFH